MMDHSECKRQYVHTGAAWYAGTALNRPDEIDEIMIGYYHPDGGTTGEFSIRWYTLGGKAAPRLEVYDDAWNALQGFRDVLDGLAELREGTVEKVLAILDKCGVEDATPKRNPLQVDETVCPTCGQTYQKARGE